MKKVFLALIGLAFGGVASAITIGWQWSALDSSLVNDSSYYMVYSTNGNLTAEEAVAAAANGSDATYNGIGSTWGATLNTSGMSVDGTTVIPGPQDKDTSVVVGNDSNVRLTFDNDEGFGLPPTSAGESGYLYLVIFNKKNIADASQFAVAKAPGTVQVDNKGQIVEGGQTPIPLDFMAPVWMAGTHQAAPEPTALALLALGIAGVALRRRVR